MSAQPPSEPSKVTEKGMFTIVESTEPFYNPEAPNPGGGEVQGAASLHLEEMNAQAPSKTHVTTEKGMFTFIESTEGFNNPGETAATCQTETECGRVRPLDEEQPFEEMIQENPEDFAAEHIRTGRGVRVVLDACNIGFATSTSTSESSSSSSSSSSARPLFNLAAICMAIDFFTAMGIEVIAFLPAAFLRKRQSQADKKDNARMITDEWETLNDLVARRVITLVPAGSDDDLFVLHYARKHCCFVVSNDFYTDHIQRLGEQNESMGRSMRLWVSMNRSAFAFVHAPWSPLAAAPSAFFSSSAQQQLQADPARTAQERYSFMLDPASALSRTVQVIQDSRVGVAAAATAAAPVNELECVEQLTDSLQAARQVVANLTAQYRALALRQGGADGGGSNRSTLAAIWNACNSLGQMVERDFAAVIADLKGTMLLAEQRGT